jgi:tight adherence protein C
MPASEFSAIRLVVAAFSTLITMILTFVFRVSFNNALLFILAIAVIAFVLPTFYVTNLIKSRQSKIRDQLPEVMDLLSVSVEAGLGFDAALSRICERLRGPIIDELNLVLIEIQLGKPRRDALKDLTGRCALEELKTFVSSIIQADHLGIPIKNVLNSQGQQLRVTRKQRAEEKAMKAPVKMMIPLVLFVFPVLFIILLGPAIIDLTNNF